MPAAVVTLGLAAALASGLPPVSFEPMSPRFAPDADQYRRLWAAEGARIVAAMEAATALPFPEAPLEALVRDGPSMIALDGSSMRLRAGYSEDYRKAVLVHELGHRLTLTLPRPAGVDDHRVLYLFLYDVWSDLYGRDFADRMVTAERRSKAHYDYESAWAWALAMDRDERQALLKAIAAQRGAGM